MNKGTENVLHVDEIGREISVGNRIAQAFDFGTMKKKTTEL
jgi:hypothetical protein